MLLPKKKLYGKKNFSVEYHPGPAVEFSQWQRSLIKNILTIWQANLQLLSLGRIVNWGVVSFHLAKNASGKSLKYAIC